MRNVIAILALALGMTLTASTANALVRYGDDLRFVADTKIPSADGTMALCHHVDYMDGLFVPVYTILQGYALSSDGCTGDMYRSVTAEDFAQLQVMGMVSADLPVEPAASMGAKAWGHAWIIVFGLALLVRGLGAIAGRGRGPRRAKTPDALAIHSLVAMSQVAIADGRIDDAEVQEIANILTRLTGKGYAPAQVMEMLSKLNPSPADLEQVGQELSEKDRQIVLEAALNIAVADGEIHPNEYAVVSDLAQRMRIGADQFRGAMARIAAHLQTGQQV